MKVSTGKIHTIMKTKNIFLTAISALFIFAACTEEKIIDEPGVSGKGDLVIELSPSSVITKAAAEDKGYVYATEEELNVQDCWIFVFDQKNGEYITSEYFAGDNLSEAEHDYVDNPAPNGGSQTYKKGYKVTLTGLDYGTYDFWVVANPTESNEAYKSCQSLDALKEIIEGGDSYQTAFADKANQLVKVGNKLAKFDVTTVASPIQIPLTQLAARVELKVRVDIPRLLVNGYYDYGDLGGKNGIWTKGEVENAFGKKNLKEVDVTEDMLDDVDADGKLLYTYFGHRLTIPTSVKPRVAKGIQLPPLTVKKYSRYSGYLLENITLQVDDIRIKSRLVSSAIVPEDSDSKIFSPLFDKVSTTYLFKFYTYAKDQLDISLHGNLYEAVYETSQEGEITGSWFVNDKEVNGEPQLVAYIRDNKEEIPEDEILKLEGGNGWGSNKMGLLLTNENTWTSIGEVIEGEPTQVSEKKEYSSGSVTLKPKNGFQVGNMYEASALIQSVPATGSLNIVIENIQSGGEINFGFN